MMPLQFTPFIIPLLIAALLSMGLIAYAWSKRPAAATTPFIFMMAGVAIWLLAYAIEISSTTVTQIIFWANINYLGIVTVPVAWLVFCLAYTNSQRIVPLRLVLLLLIEPAVILLSIWTDEFHQLFRQAVVLNTSGPFATLDITRGPLFWVHTAYSYGMLGYGIYLLFVAYTRSSGIYRSQIRVMLLGALAPWIANIFYILFLSASLPIDPTPLAFLVTGGMFAWGMFGFRLMDLAPVARNWVIEQMDDGMIVLDRQNQVVDINPAAANLIGRPVNQLIGHPGVELFAEWPDLMAQYQDVEKVITEIQLPTETGIRHIYLNILPFYDSYKQLTGRLLVIRDVTEQREADLALQIAKEKADAANRAKSTFLANMSHELRTPLTAIIGYSELLNEHAAAANDTYAPPRLEKIKTSATHLVNIVNDILDLSKIEAGQMKLHLETFNVRQVIDTAIAMVQPILMENQNEITLKIADEIETMVGDQMKVRQILLNLLHNAAKFTKKGKIEITVRPDIIDPALFLFEIKDNGIGISPEQVNKIFQPFSQADDSTARRFGGTGLGLTISQYFCQMMQGNIMLSSQPGHGSCFTVRLPSVISTPSLMNENL
ncbi:MAG: PAS domain-containing protein [Anaerolineae bacterium]|nr:PAS domain-containing protein [Anaerolineae bacterium]